MPHKMKKHEIDMKLRELGIDFDKSSKIPEMAQKLREWVGNNLPLEIERLESEHGHRILWSPPCFSDLNPIELVWAYMKRRIAA